MLCCSPADRQGLSTMLATSRRSIMPRAGWLQARRTLSITDRRWSLSFWIRQGHEGSTRSPTARHPHANLTRPGLLETRAREVRRTRRRAERWVGEQSSTPLTGFSSRLLTPPLWRLPNCLVPCTPRGGPEVTPLVARDWRKPKLLCGRYGNLFPFDFAPGPCETGC